MEEQNRCEVEMDLSQINRSQISEGSWLCCLPCYWLERNSGFHKMSLSIVTLLVTVLLVASPVLFLISNIPGEKSKECTYQGGECEKRESGKVCLTKECSKAGNRILASMSWKTNPCQNFYQFACGSWEENFEVPNEIETKFQQDHLVSFVTLQQQVDRNIQRLLTIAADSDPFRKLGIFYKSCLRVEDKRTSLLPMFSLLEELGGYVGPKEDPPGDLTDLMLSLLRLNDAPLFDVYLDSNPDNSSKLAPFIDLPVRLGFNLASEHSRHRSQNNFHRKIFSAENYLQGAFGSDGNNRNMGNMKASFEEKRLLVMEKIMKDFMPDNFSSESKTSEIRNTLHFANTITKLYPEEKNEIKSFKRGPNIKMAVEDLEKRFPFIRWQYLLEKFLKMKISPRDQIFVLTPDYLETLQRILHKFPSRVVHNGLLLSFATDTLYELVNTSSIRDWATFCYRITVKAFGKAVGALYVRQYEKEHVEKLGERITQVFNALKKSLEKRIEKISWLDEKTRRAVFQKLASLRVQFPNWPDYWNASYGSCLMEDVQANPEDFFGNVIQRYRQQRSLRLSFKKNQSEEKLRDYPFVANAFYVLTLNTIIVPLATLTQPNFEENLPLYIPYSTLGLIIAHEILHGFDLRGVGYDSEGRVKILMSQDSRAKFGARLDCFAKQFSSSFWKKVHFPGTNADVQFDWNATKNENMADIGGLQVAYQAWKSVTASQGELLLPGISLRPRQLFFLNAAQAYCTSLAPADYISLAEVDFPTRQLERVNGIMMNSLDFAEAYRCPLGSPMNPRKKCSVW